MASQLLLINIFSSTNNKCWEINFALKKNCGKNAQEIVILFLLKFVICLWQHAIVCFVFFYFLNIKNWIDLLQKRNMELASMPKLPTAVVAPSSSTAAATQSPSRKRPRELVAPSSSSASASSSSSSSTNATSISNLTISSTSNGHHVNGSVVDSATDKFDSVICEPPTIVVSSTYESANGSSTSGNLAHMVSDFEQFLSC